jgi:hypothetical protein
VIRTKHLEFQPVSELPDQEIPEVAEALQDAVQWPDVREMLAKRGLAREIRSFGGSKVRAMQAVYDMRQAMQHTAEQSYLLRERAGRWQGQVVGRLLLEQNVKLAKEPLASMPAPLRLVPGMSHQPKTTAIGIRMTAWSNRSGAKIAAAHMAEAYAAGLHLAPTDSPVWTLEPEQTTQTRTGDYSFELAWRPLGLEAKETGYYREEGQTGKLARSVILATEPDILLPGYLIDLDNRR